ncbi:MAG: PAS domain S-box protein [Candidatus Cloacimonetes bacterium]|nr:PAS domain S-box protein [Candidatus Cloacimonadota bacterium]
MNQGIFHGLVYNAALLLALGIIFEAIATNTYRKIWLSRVITGFSFGAAVLAIMLNPWVLRPGILIDTRTVLLSVTGLFFGVIPTFIAAAIAIVYRVWQGGTGAFTGCALILASAFWGLLWRSLHHKWKRPYGFWELYILGLATHITMLELMLLMPSQVALDVINTISLPVMIIFPLATVMFGQVLARRLHTRVQQNILKTNEKQFRDLYYNAPIAYQSLDVNGNILSVNYAWLQNLGYQLDEVIGKNFAEFLAPESRDKFQVSFPRFKAAGYVEGVELLLQKKDGKQILANFEGKIVYNEDGSFRSTHCVYSDITQRKQVELALEESNTKYKLLTETAQDIILVHNLTVGVSYANAKAMQFFGVSEEELPNVNLLNYVTPGYLELLKQHALERENGFMGSRLYQMELLNSEGQIKQVEVSSTPIIKDGKISGILAVVRDITERIADHLAIQESQLRFELFMQNLPGGAFIKDKDSRLLYANQFLKNHLSGWTNIGQSPLDVYPQEFAQAIIEEDQKSIESNLVLIEKDLLYNDGSIHLHETTKFALPNPNGEILLGGITMDITQRKLAEEQRNRYANRIEILHELDSIVLETLSFDSVCSAAVENLQMLIPFAVLTVNIVRDGLVQVDALLKPQDGFAYLQTKDPYIPSQAFLDELREKRTIILNQVALDTEPKDMPIRAKLIADGMKSFMYNAMIIQDEIVGFLWFTSDVEELFTAEYQEIAQEFSNQLAMVLHHLQLIEQIRGHAAELEQNVEERTEQLKAANLELETFSYTVAHDLRSPLRTIDGYCNILMDDFRDELSVEAKKLFDTIRYTAHRMDTLIKELLELAKLNRDSLKYSAVNMQNQVETICREVINRRISGLFSLQIDALPDCFADAALISQVWQNLVENAVKFTLPQTDKRIQIGSMVSDSEVIYFVKDSGVGFDMQYVGKIFVAFQRLHRDNEFEGTGIGLAIVKKIIDRHNGRLWAESEVGKGTTVFFTIPLNPESRG